MCVNISKQIKVDKTKRNESTIIKGSFKIPLRNWVMGQKEISKESEELMINNYALTGMYSNMPPQQNMHSM